MVTADTICWSNYNLVWPYDTVGGTMMYQIQILLRYWARMLVGATPSHLSQHQNCNNY